MIYNIDNFRLFKAKYDHRIRGLRLVDMFLEELYIETKLIVNELFLAYNTKPVIKKRMSYTAYQHFVSEHRNRYCNPKFNRGELFTYLLKRDEYLNLHMMLFLKKINFLHLNSKIANYEREYFKEDLPYIKINNTNTPSLNETDLQLITPNRFSYHEENREDGLRYCKHCRRDASAKSFEKFQVLSFHKVSRLFTDPDNKDFYDRCSMCRLEAGGDDTIHNHDHYLEGEVSLTLLKDILAKHVNVILPSRKIVNIHETPKGLLESKFTSEKKVSRIISILKGEHSRVSGISNFITYVTIELDSNILNVYLKDQHTIERITTDLFRRQSDYSFKLPAAVGTTLDINYFKHLELRNKSNRVNPFLKKFISIREAATYLVLTERAVKYLISKGGNEEFTLTWVLSKFRVHKSNLS